MRVLDGELEVGDREIIVLLLEHQRSVLQRLNIGIFLIKLELKAAELLLDCGELILVRLEGLDGLLGLAVLGHQGGYAAVKEVHDGEVVVFDFDLVVGLLEPIRLARVFPKLNLKFTILSP